jgi:hypothetical protein
MTDGQGLKGGQRLVYKGHGKILEDMEFFYVF